MNNAKIHCPRSFATREYAWKKSRRGHCRKSKATTGTTSHSGSSSRAASARSSARTSLTTVNPCQALLFAGVALTFRRRRDRGAVDAMASQRPGDESGGFHLFDEAAQILRCRLAAPRDAHRLIDHHESTFEQSQAPDTLRIRFHLLLHSRRHVEPLGHEQVGHRLRGRRAHDRRTLELAREE